MKLELLEKTYNEQEFKDFIATLGVKVEEDRLRDDGLSSLEKKHIKAYKFLGKTARLSDKSVLGCFAFEAKDKNIENKRVAFGDIIQTLARPYRLRHALVAIYHPESVVWRLTYVSFTIKDGELLLNTNLKRSTYVLGENIAIKTAKEQIGALANVAITRLSLEEVFSVENLNKQFFEDYKKLFEMVNHELIENNFATFEREESHIRAFSKKLLGRIVFLYFLQKKGWLGVDKIWGDGDRKFLKKTFESVTKSDKNFYEVYLKPIFFEALNSPRDDDYFDILECKMPFLNGGLFESKGFDDAFLMIDNKIFAEIFKILSHYNFTIIEDLPHDGEVAIDPEMLGKVFENLLEENYRSGKGAFYTPREIVHYMCKESLYAYLVSDSSNKDALKAFVFEGKTEDIEKKHLREKIKSIKILDPSIGSGAFPMGMLAEIMELLLILDPTLDTAKTKKNIIENSIYGIDIDNSAVDIAKLRFWLSIVVDEEIPTPLPNLDFKIMQGNSLIETIDDFSPIPPDIYEQKESKAISLFEKIESLFDEDTFTLLKENIHDFYREINPTSKQKLKKKIQKQVEKIIYSYIEYKEEELANRIKDFDAGVGVAKQEKLLKAMEILEKNLKTAKNIIKEMLENNFQTTELFLYKLWFGEVIKEGGFDVVIGNPPYIMEDKNKEAFQGLHSQPCYQGKTDIWHLFTCKGLNLLKPKGILSFIAKNQWLNSASSSNMRKKLYSDSEIKYIIDFGANMMFENADVQTMILLIEKNSKNITHNIKYYRYEKQKIEDIKKSLETHDLEFTEKEIPKDYNHKENLTFSSKENEVILSKIDKLKNFEFDEKKEIIQGIIGGPDKAFIVSFDKLQNFTKEERKYFKMLHTSTGKFFTADTQKYICYINRHNFKDKSIEEYPNIEKFFEKTKEDLIQKKINYKTPTKPYFYLHRERNESFFKEGDKLVWAKRTEGKKFTFTGKSFYGTANLFFIKSSRVNLKYMSALLNSQLMYFYMQERLKHTGDLLQLDKNQFLKIPLYVPEDIKPFEILVDYVMFLKTQDLEAKGIKYQLMPVYFEQIIDGMVYELYFEELLKKHDRDIIQYLGELPDIGDMEDEKKISLLFEVFLRLDDLKHKVRNNLFYMDSIPEIKLIKGK